MGGFWLILASPFILMLLGSILRAVLNIPLGSSVDKVKPPNKH